MSIETLLSKLEKVRPLGHGKWMASCPCHADKTPSLSIKDDAGTILLHCFSQQCAPYEICSTIGIEITDLFPPSDNWDASQSRSKRVYYDAQQALQALAVETLVVHIISNDMMRDGSISPDEHERLVAATIRINAALEYTKRISG